MNGNVCQTHSERKNKSQFGDTVKALRVYSSQMYKSDIKYLNVLFTNLQETKVIVSDDPVETVTMDASGKIETSISKFEDMKYTESIKQWIRDDKSLKTTIRSLHNIIWG